MTKNYRRIPNNILDKIDTLLGKELIVGTVLKIKESDIHNSKYKDLSLSLDNGNISFNNNIIPSLDRGRYSKKNILGYKIKYKNKAKVSHTYYAGERPFFGDWKKGSFSLYITKEIYPFDIFVPKELLLNIQLLKNEEINNEKYYIFKIIVGNVLGVYETNFSDNLLFNINLLQENFGSSDIFSIDSTSEDYLDTLVIDWDIFPPGKRDNDLKRIIGSSHNISPKRLSEISDRYDFIRKLNPLKIITGKSGMRSYFGAKFSDNLVVFENKDYGNALYILFENWEELSKLSRTEIQNRPADQYIRIPHIGDWEKRAIIVINNKK